MPVVRIKDIVLDWNGARYTQNQKVTLPDATAARMVAHGVAELVDPKAAIRSFTDLVATIEEVRARNRRPMSKAIREKAEAERRAFRERQGFGPQCATQFG